MRRLLACCLILGTLYSIILPQPVHAESATVVFFSGLCYSKATCTAAQTFIAQSKIASGAKLVAPPLRNGAFADGNSAREFINSLGNTKIVFVAYSAGYKALWQTVQSMNTEELRRVSSVTSLEAEYSGFENSVARIRSVNPTVKVYRIKSSQFGTNHSGLPDSSGVADMVQALSAAAISDTSVDVSQYTRTPVADPIQTALHAGDTQSMSSYYANTRVPTYVTPTSYTPVVMPQASLGMTAPTYPTMPPASLTTNAQPSITGSTAYTSSPQIISQPVRLTPNIEVDSHPQPSVPRITNTSDSTLRVSPDTSPVKEAHDSTTLHDIPQQPQNIPHTSSATPITTMVTQILTIIGSVLTGITSLLSR